MRERQVNTICGMRAVLILLVTMSALLFGWKNPTYAKEKPPGDRSTYDVRIKQKATETTDGIREYRDKATGKLYLEKIPKTGHVWGEWKVVKRPTEDSDGYKERHCIRYGRGEHSAKHFQKAVISKTAGEWKPWVVDRKPTGIVEGLKHRDSTDNAKRVQYDIIPNLRQAMILNTGETLRPVVLDSGTGEVPDENRKVIRHDASGEERDARAPGSYEGETPAGGNAKKGSAPFSTADAVIIGANGTVAGIWVVLLFPMFKVAFWISAKKRAIRRKGI